MGKNWKYFICDVLVYNRVWNGDLFCDFCDNEFDSLSEVCVGNDIE